VADGPSVGDTVRDEGDQNREEGRSHVRDHQQVQGLLERIGADADGPTSGELEVRGGGR
jgi:hypothetical protein